MFKIATSIAGHISPRSLLVKEKIRKETVWEQYNINGSRPFVEH
jgi:hypothetical protein